MVSPCVLFIQHLQCFFLHSHPCTAKLLKIQRLKDFLLWPSFTKWAPISFLNRVITSYTLQETNISHLWQRKTIFTSVFLGGYVSSQECKWPYKWVTGFWFFHPYKWSYFTLLRPWFFRGRKWGKKTRGWSTLHVTWNQRFGQPTSRSDDILATWIYILEISFQKCNFPGKAGRIMIKFNSYIRSTWSVARMILQGMSVLFQVCKVCYNISS